VSMAGLMGDGKGKKGEGNELDNNVFLTGHGRNSEIIL